MNIQVYEAEPEHSLQLYKLPLNEGLECLRGANPCDLLWDGV